MLHMQHTILHIYITMGIVKGGQRMKNITFENPMVLKEEISYISNKIVKKVIVQNTYMNVTLLAFSQGMKLPTHTSSGTVLLSILEGTACIRISDVDYCIQEGQSIAIQANVHHAVHAQEAFKMIVIVDFSRECRDM